MLSKLDCFEVIREVGRGPHGAVYAGRNLYTGESVAIKQLDGWLPDNEEQREELRVTVQRLLRLSHANILSLRRIVQSGGRCYIVSQFAELRPVNEKWPKRVENPQEVFALLGPALQALRHAHSLQLPHGHLSLSNLGWAGADTLLVSDFAVAHLFRCLKQSEPGRRMAPQLAPEVLASTIPDVRSDVYSLASLLHVLCTHSLPPRERRLMAQAGQLEPEDIAGETRFSFLEISSTTAKAGSSDELLASKDIPEPFRAAIEWALSEKPEDRPATLDEFLEALRDGVAKTAFASATSAAAGIRFCAQCGRALPEHGRLCLGCGQPVDGVGKTAAPEPTRATTSGKSYFHELGDWLLLNQRRDEAIRAYQMAVRHEQSVELYRELGNALTVEKRWLEAEQAYERALAISEASAQRAPGERVQLRYALAQVMIARNSYTKAADLLVLVVAESESTAFRTQAKMSLAAAYSFRRRYGLAIQVLEQVIAENPQQPAPHFCIGNVYAEMGEWDSATSEFLKVLAMQPDHEGAAEALVQVQRQQYRDDGASWRSPLAAVLLGGVWAPWILASEPANERQRER